MSEPNPRGVWVSPDWTGLAIEAEDGSLVELEHDADAGWVSRGMLDCVPGHWVRLVPLPDSETEPDNWESGAYIEPGIGGVANVSTSGWPGGVNRVWLNVTSYSDKNRGADIVLEPDEADEIATVLRGAAQSVRRDPGVTL